LANVEQVRAIQSKFLRLLDRSTFRVAGLFGWGPWYCISCGKREWLFPPFRRRATTYDPRSRLPSAPKLGETELLGNVFLSNVSLINRSNRARNFSEKFRDGVAAQLLSGTTTFSAVRQRLDVTELDLQDWIARYHNKCMGPEYLFIAAERMDPSKSAEDGRPHLARGDLSMELGGDREAG
jgi:hypothetical protein